MNSQIWFALFLGVIYLLIEFLKRGGDSLANEKRDKGVVKREKNKKERRL